MSAREEGMKISLNSAGELSVPHRVSIPFIMGDGTGPDIWKAAQVVFDHAVQRAYSGERSVCWVEVFAGEKAFAATGEWLPQETLRAIEQHVVAIKGPLTTPVGGGIRSLNVALRQELDLFACVRPIRYYPGVPSPLINPERVDMIVFRENTEDVYAGLEVQAGSKEAEQLAQAVRNILGKEIRSGSGIGIKPVSEFCSKRLVRMAVQHALKTGASSVTLVHKGNIMKFTEGAFRVWGYEAADEFGDRVVREGDLAEKYGGQCPLGKVLIKDRIADSMFQQIQLRPDEYSVIATTNLNGDYLSDALAALVGGLGMAPGANIGARAAVFEATHGTAPKYAGQDKVNPCSVILSGKMMFDYLGWGEVSALIESAVEATVAERIVTYDLARSMDKAKEVSCSGFAQAMVDRMG